MKWMNKKPTKEGWYWYRATCDIIPTILHLAKYDVMEVFIMNNWKPLETNCPGEWAGPIPEPDNQ